MSNQKTIPTETDALGILNRLPDEKQKADCLALLKLMQTTTRKPPVVWGKDLIGFGSYHYVYDSGREGDWFCCGFVPRKKTISIYILPDLETAPELLNDLGTFKRGSSCLTIRSMDDIHQPTLKKLIVAGRKRLREMYG